TVPWLFEPTCDGLNENFAALLLVDAARSLSPLSLSLRRRREFCAPGSRLRRRGIPGCHSLLDPVLSSKRTRNNRRSIFRCCSSTTSRKNLSSPSRRTLYIFRRK